MKLEGRAQRCQDVAPCGGVTGAYQDRCLPGNCQHTALLLQRCHSFLSPTMASSNDPFRTPQSTTQAFESGAVRVSDQFVYLRSIFYFLAYFQPSHPCAPVFCLFPTLCFCHPQRCSMFVATPCESVGFVGYRNTYAHTQRS